MPVRTVAREIGEHDTKLWRLIDHHVEEVLKDQDFPNVSAIGMDEYSDKGHNYITVFLSHPDVVTMDKFHVIKNCSDAVDNTRPR